MKKNFNHKKDLSFVVCQFCGYNNEFNRFQNYGTCLRCHKIIDPKVYLKRKLWETNNRKYIREEDYYD